MIRGFVVCGEIGQACPIKCGMPSHDGKIVDFPLSYLPKPWGWGLKVEIQLFPRTASTQPNTTKDICTGTPCADPGIFFRAGGGGGVQAPQLILQSKEVVQRFYYTFSRGRPTFSRGGGPIETHITITCDFPGGPDPLSPLWIRTWTLWHFGKNRLKRACAASF